MTETLFWLLMIAVGFIVWQNWDILYWKLWGRRQMTKDLKKRAAALKKDKMNP